MKTQNSWINEQKTRTMYRIRTLQSSPCIRLTLGLLIICFDSLGLLRISWLTTDRYIHTYVLWATAVINENGWYAYIDILTYLYVSYVFRIVGNYLIPKLVVDLMLRCLVITVPFLRKETKCVVTRNPNPRTLKLFWLNSLFLTQSYSHFCMCWNYDQIDGICYIT